MNLWRGVLLGLAICIPFWVIVWALIHWLRSAA
jgi:hypothetical protein